MLEYVDGIVSGGPIPAGLLRVWNPLAMAHRYLAGLSFVRMTIRLPLPRKAQETGHAVSRCPLKRGILFSTRNHSTTAEAPARLYTSPRHKDRPKFPLFYMYPLQSARA
jgi:hypothetical protein